MAQSWRDLLFAHWPVPVDALRRHVPDALEVEEYDGRAWVGLTPFRMEDVRLRFLPAIPGVSSFPEMNLRTYVREGGRSGIYFFSLDAGSRIAVAAARSLYRLPYHHASMSLEKEEGGWIRYRSRRRSDGAEFRGRYRPAGRVFEAEPGTLEHFLTERYALFAVTGEGRVLRGDIHHPPWPLQEAEVEIEVNTVGAESGIALTGPPTLAHYAVRQDSLVWLPSRHSGRTGSPLS